MNTHFIKIIFGISLTLTLTLTQFSFANSDKTTDTDKDKYTAVPADKRKELNYKLETIDLTSKTQPPCHLKRKLSDRRAKGRSGLSTGQSFLDYQVNGQVFTQAFRIKDRVLCSLPDTTMSNERKNSGK